MNKIIRLYDAGLGLLIPCPSGVIYSNQTCGNICMQPEIEGVFVPLDAEDGWRALAAHFEGPKYMGSGAMLGLDQEDADVVDRILRECRIVGIVTDRARLVDSHEAWVHAVIEGESASGSFTGFGPYPRPGILTWPNSD
ncbi:DUF6210 family protein [Sorangium sp. So ce117]|uniref:DUF6210 family protein n=1 Tax=Sorangium sp. So ce117 TaxID=3133277 RepID=UPI003F5F3DD8